MEKDLNKNELEVKNMETMYKRNYNILFNCVQYTREELLKSKKKGKLGFSKKEEERLIKIGFIDWDKNSLNLHHPDFIITRKGENYYRPLRKTWKEDANLVIVILSFIFSLVALIMSLKP